MTDPQAETKATPPELPASGAAYTDGQGFRFACPNCRMEVPVAESTAEFRCNYCKAISRIRLFPRLRRELPRDKTPAPAAGDEATCQFFPELRAELFCDECGCFMSKRASVNWGGRKVCIPCLHNLRENKKDIEFRPGLKLWDNRALGLLALVPLTLFTAPLALFLLLRYRNAPRGWVPRSSFRWWLAMVLTIGFLTAWIALIVVWIAMVIEEMQ